MRHATVNLFPGHLLFPAQRPSADGCFGGLPPFGAPFVLHDCTVWHRDRNGVFGGRRFPSFPGLLARSGGPFRWLWRKKWGMATSCCFAMLLACGGVPCSVQCVPYAGAQGCPPPPRPPCENNALVGVTVGVVSATFGIVFYFALYKYAPLSEQRQVLFPSDFGILVLLSQGRVVERLTTIRSKGAVPPNGFRRGWS